jgi:hypothetical protein
MWLWPLPILVWTAGQKLSRTFLPCPIIARIFRQKATAQNQAPARSQSIGKRQATFSFARVLTGLSLHYCNRGVNRIAGVNFLFFNSLLGSTNPNFSGRAHFFGAAAEAMRRLVINLGAVVPGQPGRVSCIHPNRSSCTPQMGFTFHVNGNVTHLLCVVWFFSVNRQTARVGSPPPVIPRREEPMTSPDRL